MKLLFIDDDVIVLHGLERVLDSLEGDWECRFANSGQEALAMLDQGSADVVVSDLRMPQMDGAALLDRIHAKYPETVRIVLSGHADQATSLRTVKSAHQYLAKPCASEVLLATLERAKLLRRLITDAPLRGLVAKLPNLPSVPAAYDGLVRELNQPEVSMDRVCHYIASDVAMSAKVLQLVNSAFFGLPRQILDVRQAASLLGLDLLGSLVLSAQAFTMFSASGPLASRSQALQTHSLNVSAAARAIATRAKFDKPDVDAAAVAGMLHDIGELAIESESPTASQWIRKAVSGGAPVWDAERQFLGTTHAAVGAYLLGTWGLPISVVQAVEDQVAPRPNPDATATPAQVVHVADAYVGELQASEPSFEGLMNRLHPAFADGAPGTDLAAFAWDLTTQADAA